MKSALVNLTSIEKRYNKSVALGLEELTINRGRLHLLTGPNGSGKSTLLSILALLTRPDHGEMFFAGKRVNWGGSELNHLRKNVTLLHQSPYLFQGTVFDNIAFGLSVRGIFGSEARQRITEALTAVNLKGFGDRKIEQLSGGEAQRVALARALVIRPELLLLDESLSNIDKESASLLEKVISALPDNGTSVVMSSHDPHLQERLVCDIISLHNGRLVNSQPCSHTAHNPGKEMSICPTFKMHAA